MPLNDGSSVASEAGLMEFSLLLHVQESGKHQGHPRLHRRGCSSCVNKVLGQVNNCTAEVIGQEARVKFETLFSLVRNKIALCVYRQKNKKRELSKQITFE